jgi:hypothetical protein
VVVASVSEKKIRDMVKKPNIEQAFKKVCAALIEVKRDNISTGKFLTYKRLLLSELKLKAR